MTIKTASGQNDCPRKSCSLLDAVPEGCSKASCNFLFSFFLFFFFFFLFFFFGTRRAKAQLQAATIFTNPKSELSIGGPNDLTVVQQDSVNLPLLCLISTTTAGLLLTQITLQTVKHRK
jgi:hypothetical protein